MKRFLPQLIGRRTGAAGARRAVAGSYEARHRVFAQTCPLLLNRIRLFTSLSLAKLDRLLLQNTLREIGKS